MPHIWPYYTLDENLLPSTKVRLAIRIQNEGFGDPVLNKDL